MVPVMRLIGRPEVSMPGSRPGRSVAAEKRRKRRVRVRGHDGVQRLGAAELGESPGERATLVQFSSTFCAPCRATRRILAEVAGLVPGVAHVEVDAEARPDLVEALRIEQTPTVFVLDADGRIVRRAAGMPRKVDVIAALGVAV